MKARICPECGKHNPENAFNCVACGATLSIKTLVDTESRQFENIKPVAGLYELVNISPNFETDVIDLLKRVNRDFENIVWGCNVTQATRNGEFSFGYLIFTSQRVIKVAFKPITERKKTESIFALLENPVNFITNELFGMYTGPKRQFFEVWPTRNSRKPFLAIAPPQYPLTPAEMASRNEISYALDQVKSCQLESIGYQDTILIDLRVLFQPNAELTATFYSLHEAEKACRLVERAPSPA